MAKKKGSSDTSTAPSDKYLKELTPHRIRSLWTQIDATDWMHLLRTVCPESNWTTGNRLIKGRCPFHADKDPSFIVNFNNRHAKCYGGDCGKYFWDPIRFYMALHKNTVMSYATALTELKEKYSLKLPKVLIKELSRRQQRREMKHILFHVMRGELIDAQSMLSSPKPPPELLYLKDTVAYLEYRKLPPEWHLLPVGVMPPELRLEKLVKDKCQALKVEDCWEEAKAYLGANMDVQWHGALVFFTGESPNDICRLKLRRVPPRVNGFFDTSVKDISMIKDEFETSTGVFGLCGVDMYQPYFASRQIKSFVYVEGEFDALAVIAHQIEKTRINFMCFSGGGGGTEGLDLLSNYGFQTGHIIGDRDEGGEKFIAQTMEKTTKLGMRIFNWPQRLLIKDVNGDALSTIDPDEAIKTWGFDAFEEEACNLSNYTLPHLWAIEKATKDMDAIDPNDIRFLTARAIHWGKLVRNSTEQFAYVEALKKQFTVDAGHLLVEIASTEETEDTFITRLTDVLATRLHVMQLVQTKTTPFLRVFDRKSECVCELAVGDMNRIRAVLEGMFKTDLLTYVTNEVGIPSFLATEDDDQTKSVYTQKSIRINNYFTLAISRLLATVPPTKDLKYLGAGVHAIAPALDKPDADFCMYLVNGVSMYKAEYNGHQCHWTQLSGPSDGQYVAYIDGELTPAVYLPFVKSADDLNYKSSWTIESLFNQIYALVSTAWGFKKHYLSSELLTAFVMHASVGNCFPRHPMIMLTSDQQGGKTSFMGGLIGKQQSPICLVYDAVFLDNYTGAGIRQKMNYSSLCLCLDEFEDKGTNDSKSVTMRRVLDQYRGHASSHGVTVMGSTSGIVREYCLPHPLIIAGIRGLHEHADLSRFILVEMNRDATRPNPEGVILQMIGAERVQEIKHDLPLVMYQNVYALREAYFKIAEEYQQNSSSILSSRGRERFYGLMAIMKLAGRDYKSFLESYTSQHYTEIKYMSTAALHNDLFQELLSSPNIRLPDTDDMRPRTLNSILASNKPEILNDTQSGLYYDEETHWLGVHWPTVIHTIIRYTELRGQSPIILKQHASRHKRHVTERAVARTGVLERLQPVIGRIISQSDISFFQIEEMVTDAEARRPEVKGRDTETPAEEYKEKLKGVKFPTPPPLPPEKKKSQNTLKLVSNVKHRIVPTDDI